VATKDIRPSTAYTTCDVCGRTLLRGERAQVYLDGAARRSVCELCTTRAVHEGWVREGSVPAFDGRPASERRRSLFSRLRGLRERKRAPEPELEGEGGEIYEEPDRAAWVEPPAAPPPRPASRAREPRHVRAIPTSTEHKMASAIDAFNVSEHPRTVAGVARSLGPPTVSVRPAGDRPSLVNIVASWELCWYRYEVDLSEEDTSVRVAAQGYELDELSDQERHANAGADENGRIALG
jgi:hypothetical protein